MYATIGQRNKEEYQWKSLHMQNSEIQGIYVKWHEDSHLIK